MRLYAKSSGIFCIWVQKIGDIEQRETDFLVTIDNNPWFAVEVKHSSRNISKPLKFFTTKLDIPFSYQVVNAKGIDFVEKGIRVISADKFLTGLI